ncbi:hypothetical protein C8Q74DRAFT_1217033 [Fomes fomentarius]|nr:hypothetical protein C8Q74DRAFT_1217033 [Fomes fomentarius]
MFFSPTFLALALALTASASPILDGLGTRVALEQRRSLTQADGWFDHAQAMKQVVRDRNKHRKNLINLKNNIGEENMNANPEGHAASQHEKRQAEPLTDYKEVFWAGNIAIGSNKKTFLIDFDSMSLTL